jgi:hypothetical protein
MANLKKKIIYLTYGRILIYRGDRVFLHKPTRKNLVIVPSQKFFDLEKFLIFFNSLIKINIFFYIFVIFYFDNFSFLLIS